MTVNVIDLPPTGCAAGTEIQKSVRVFEEREKKIFSCIIGLPLESVPGNGLTGI